MQCLGVKSICLYITWQKSLDIKRASLNNINICFNVMCWKRLVSCGSPLVFPLFNQSSFNWFFLYIKSTSYIGLTVYLSTLAEGQPRRLIRHSDLNPSCSRGYLRTSDLLPPVCYESAEVKELATEPKKIYVQSKNVGENIFF